MTNIYFIQLVGVVLVAAGALALTAASYLFGTALTREEEERLKVRKGVNWYRLPISLETIAASAVFLAGMGILWWSKFSFCAFLAYWLPDLPYAIKFWLSCR